VAKLVKHLHKESALETQDPVCFRVRNSATHMALIDSAELRLATIQMVKFGIS